MKYMRSLGSAKHIYKGKYANRLNANVVEDECGIVALASSVFESEKDPACIVDYPVCKKCLKAQSKKNK